MSTLDILMIGFGVGYYVGVGVAVFVTFWIVLPDTAPTITVIRAPE